MGVGWGAVSPPSRTPALLRVQAWLSGAADPKAPLPTPAFRVRDLGSGLNPTPKQPTPSAAPGLPLGHWGLSWQAGSPWPSVALLSLTCGALMGPPISSVTLSQACSLLGR